MMENRKSIVLIQPHCSFRLCGASALLTKFDAVGPLALRAFLENQGFQTKIIHFGRALETGYSLEKILTKIKEADPFLFGISMNWVHLSAGALEVAELLKQHFPDVPVIIGGSHATLFSREIMDTYHPIVDGVALGEAEECLAEVAFQAYEHKPFYGIDGLMTYHEGQITYRQRKIVTDLDELPFYSYKDIWPRTSDLEAGFLAALNTTRGGCVKSCNFCLESYLCYEKQRRVASHFSPERLIEQVLFFQKQGRGFITIQDQITSHGDALLTGFIEGLCQKGITLDHLSIFVEPNSLSHEVYDLLEKAPVKELVLSFGIETGSPEVSRNMGRPYDYRRLYDELEYVGKKSFYTATWWMIGLPGEEEKDLLKTMKMIEETMKMGVSAHSVSPLILFPRTKLAETADLYDIEKYMTTFEDFKKFSYTGRNDEGLYPELITHAMPYQPMEMTISYIRKIKQFIGELEERNPRLKQKQEKAISGYPKFRKTEIF